MKRLIYLLALILSFSSIAAQQERVVKGKVSDKEGLSIPGVNIVIKGTQQGTITNESGEYEISVPENGTLTFSSVGYLTEEIPVHSQSTIDVVLVEDIFHLDELVVVGYGSSSAKDLTGTISVVHKEELSKQAVPNIGQALQGKVAGIQVTNDGTPGGKATIRVRGLGTVRAEADPLYVVDGMFVDDISFLSPQQIENVTILKDASSAAIYGVRAANGVILITTSKGSAKKPELSYSGYYGIQQVSNLLEMADKNEYITLLNEKILIGEERGTPSTTFDPTAYSDNTNWFEEVTNPARIQNHNIGISGGNEFSTFYYGLGITSQEGLIKTNDFARVNFRATNDIKVNKLIRAGYGVTLSGQKSNDAPNDAPNVLNQAYVAPPAFSPMTDEGTFTDPVILGFGNFANPSATIQYFNKISRGINSLANIYSEITPFRELSLKTSFSIDAKYNETRDYTPKYWVSVTQNDTISHLYKSNSQHFNYTFDNTITYDKVFGDHHLKMMAGLSFVQFKSQGIYATTASVPYFTESTLYLSNGSIDDISAGDWGSLIRSESWFGRLFYSYREKYLLTATFRRDGSSTFPSEQRWGSFPSIGIGWVASNEDFIRNLELFDFLKIKASWGKLGNNHVPQNAYTVTVNKWDGYSIVYGPYGSSAISPGASITSIVEPQLRWEIVEEFDAGFEALLLQSRLNIDFDFYRRMTKAAIFPVPVIGTSGTSGTSYLDNNADILNQGIELTLNWTSDISEELSLSLGGNFSFNRNEVYRLEQGTLPFYDANAFNGALATYTQEGHPIGEFYVLDVDGIFQNTGEVTSYVDSSGNQIMPDAVPGDFRYVDHNGDGFIDDLDRIPYGSYTPKVLYAFNIAITYRNFDLSIDFHGVAGNKIYNAKRIGRYGNENYDANFAENRWHGEGTSNTFPSADVAGGRNAYPNTFFVESGAYFRIRTLQLGYSLPLKRANKLSLQGIRLYISVQNPFTRFSYNGFSPEIPGGSPTTAGMDYGIYPLSRITSAGITVNF